MISYRTFLARIFDKIEHGPKDIHPLYWSNIVIGESRFKNVCLRHNLRYVEELGINGEYTTFSDGSSRTNMIWASPQRTF